MLNCFKKNKETYFDMEEDNSNKIWVYFEDKYQ